MLTVYYHSTRRNKLHTCSDNSLSLSLSLSSILPHSLNMKTSHNSIRSQHCISSVHYALGVLFNIILFDPNQSRCRFGFNSYFPPLPPLPPMRCLWWAETLKNLNPCVPWPTLLSHIWSNLVLTSPICGFIFPYMVV
jgi:hypothetical protein